MPASTSHPARWDLFCRVVDNFGDIGVAWRLAADLASRGQAVRLWVDDPSLLAWMAPLGHPGVEQVHWSAEPPDLEPAACVVETFGCDPPPRFVERMAQAAHAPVWINLEYLSAESYVERCHGLPSPQLAGPGQGLTKWFFYPGLTPRTGGLLREHGLLEARAAFDRDAWLAARGLERHPGEQVVSLFSYANAGLPAMLERLAQRPTLLLVTPGHSAQAMAESPVQAVRAALAARGLLRVAELPLLPQSEFDRLLWACDLNFVRGEDSFVRAQWAGAPFVWQIYPQIDGVHARKLEAFLDAYLAGATPALARELRATWAAWNGLVPWGGHGPAWAAWHEHAADWPRRLAGMPDLSSELLRFVQRKR